MTTTGRPFTTTSVQIIRIREGHIVHSRDFADPRILEDATGNRAGKLTWVPDAGSCGGHVKANTASRS